MARQDDPVVAHTKDLTVRFGDTPASVDKDANALVGDTGNDLFEKEFIYAKVCEALTRS